MTRALFVLDLRGTNKVIITVFIWFDGYYSLLMIDEADGRVRWERGLVGSLH